MDEEIIVIGAGIAGLSAAHRLTAEGFRVTVLEGRDRIGGRVWTDTSLGTPVDLGASWIHGIRRNPLTALANQAGISTVATDFDALALYDIDGSVLNDDDLDKLAEMFERVLADLRDVKKYSNADLSIASALSTILGQDNLTDDQRRGVDWVIASEIEFEAAADLYELSLHYWDEDDAFNGEDVLFPDGYVQIARELAAGLEIRLSHVVSEIAHEEQGVVVTTDCGEFRGQRTVITLPLGILRAGSVTFTPVLPASKQNAIHRLDMGTLNKLAMRFDHRFWPNEKHFLGYLKEGADDAISFLNLFPYSGKNLLLGFVSGTHARSWEQNSASAVVDEAMWHLRGMFGNSIPMPTASTFTKWHSDPFSKGSYSHVPPGGSLSDYEEIAQPVEDRLFFAGEATTKRYPGTVHGALISGWREADRIMQRAVS